MPLFLWISAWTEIGDKAVRRDAERPELRPVWIHFLGLVSQLAHPHG
jgi:hypothetical protein